MDQPEDGDEIAASARLDDEPRFEWLVANLPAVIYRCHADEHWTMHFISPFVEELTGFSASDFLGNAVRSFASVIHPDDREMVHRTMIEDADVDRPFELEYRIVRADGTVRWVREQGHGVRDAEGRLLFMDGAIFDITTRREMELAEIARRESLARQRRSLVEIATNPAVGEGDLSTAAVIMTETMAWALDASRASIWLLDDTRTRLQLVDLFVTNDGEHTHDIVIAAEDVPRYFAAMRSGRIVDAHDARTDPRTSEFTDSYLVPLDIHAMLDAAIRTGGEVVGVVCIEQTGAPRTWADHELNFAGEVADQVAQTLLNREQRRADLERERLQGQLFRAQKMEAVGRLAGGVAHDFNNLITAIAGYAGLLLEDLHADDPRREDAAEIAATTDRARELTRQLLAFSRREEIEIHAVDLSRVVANLERMLQRLIEEAFELELSIAPEHMVVNGNEGLIEQVVTNLVVNARDAMPMGGRIVVSTGREFVESSRAAALDGIEPGHYGWLRVEDTGVGISADDQGKIFEPFFTTKEQGRGTGLGLSTVYGIARRCGGSVEVRSELGRGTVFTVFFPVATPGRGEARPGAANDRGIMAGEGRKIVVVEDERSVRELAVRVLSRAGFEVTSAANGQIAMELLADLDEAPALVITDMIMPEAGGVDVLNWMRQHMIDVPILLMSGYIDDATRRQAEGVPRMQKPFTPAELRRRVVQMLRPDGEEPAEGEGPGGD